MFERESDWREHAGPAGVEPPTKEELAKKKVAAAQAQHIYGKPQDRGEKKTTDPFHIDDATGRILNALHD